ncbi:hypothetical protein KSS87_005059 [Heliosperma pusillum]|nr:hypothetical protein KSS87_005059 [Heliosperma pusillum]
MWQNASIMISFMWQNTELPLTSKPGLKLLICDNKRTSNKIYNVVNNELIYKHLNMLILYICPCIQQLRLLLRPVHFLHGFKTS